MRITLAFVITSMLAAAPLHAQTARAAPPKLADLSRDLQTLSERVMPSVVQIFATVYDDQELVNPAEYPATVRTSGAGVILDPDGYIVTNAHLVVGAVRVQVGVPAIPTGAPGATSILRAAGKVVGAQIVALDHETDVAVLKIAERNLPALPIADSDALQPGQIVLAFGSPFGLENSVTMGVVSAVARQVEPEDPMIYIQTDASINPGNSGGPLVDVEGRLVGINTFILSQSGGSEGLGFAAPSNIVKNVFDQIRKTGRVRRGEIAVFAQTITPVLAAGLGLPQDWGVVIADVFPESEAEAAGLRIGDVVLALDGKRMENGRQFQVNLYGRAIGEPVTLDVQRGRERLSIRVPVTERPDDPVRFSVLASAEQGAIPRLGLVALDLTDTVRDLLPDLRRASGVVVAALLPRAPVSREGTLEPGDVIHAVNGAAVSSVAELRAAVARLQPDASAVLQIERGGLLQFFGFRIER